MDGRLTDNVEASLSVEPNISLFETLRRQVCTSGQGSMPWGPASSARLGISGGAQHWQVRWWGLGGGVLDWDIGVRHEDPILFRRPNRGLDVLILGRVGKRIVWCGVG